MSVRPDIRETGFEFIGSIPSDWSVVPLRHVAHIKYGLGQPPKSKEGGLPIIRATNVERGKLNLTDLITVDPDDVPYDRDPILRAGDIIVVRSGAYTADSAIIPPEFDGAIAGYDMVMRAHAVEPKLLAYALLSRYLRENQLFLKRMRAAQPHLNAEELGTSILVLPPAREQRSIVAFLDHQTGLIDELIEKNTKLLELLDDQRKAIINEAVTKGLDPKAPMKDSGVEWLGEVPESWAIGTLKRYADVSFSSVDRKDVEGGEKVGICHYPIAYRNEFISKETVLDEGSCSISELDRFSLRQGRIILTKDSESADDIGIPAYVSEDIPKAVCGYHLALVDTTSGKILPEFLFRFMQSDRVMGYYAANTNGVTRYGLGKPTIENLNIVIPSLADQKRLAEEIWNKTRTIDEIKVRVNSTIERLGAYRSSLISEAVTGKIDLREWVPEPLSLAK